ncbi:hypothetical protein CAPTEDRAFT_210362 [Capitella teleta]|uniref:Uncharacterized protein n=1 Tax=Capitella teleta TaxID=283909 RepID=N1PBA9_CAPTE|nr:hypothetical protein CAPTEDRAFT_210362 [Capitella teleta]|eukprot:ELU18885.1 hypothetical protein CAPTEDRAFT_210362 [Capitella teleta]
MTTERWNSCERLETDRGAEEPARDNILHAFPSKRLRSSSVVPRLFEAHGVTIRQLVDTDDDPEDHFFRHAPDECRECNLSKTHCLTSRRRHSTSRSGQLSVTQWSKTAFYNYSLP